MAVCTLHVLESCRVSCADGSSVVCVLASAAAVVLGGARRRGRPHVCGASRGCGRWCLNEVYTNAGSGPRCTLVYMLFVTG